MLSAAQTMWRCWWIIKWKECRRKWSWPNLRHYTGTLDKENMSRESVLWFRLGGSQIQVRSVNSLAKVHIKLDTGKTTSVYRECFRGNLPYFKRIFPGLNCINVTKKTYIQSWMVLEVMMWEIHGLLAVPCTVPV